MEAGLNYMELGCWTLKSVINMWVREDGTPMDGKSDSVATGLVTLVLQQASLPGDHAQVQKGLLWLMRNQAPQGFWPASSVNKRHHKSSETKLFMTDAGTAFAVLALTQNQVEAGPHFGAHSMSAAVAAK